MEEVGCESKVYVKFQVFCGANCDLDLLLVIVMKVFDHQVNEEN